SDLVSGKLDEVITQIDAQSFSGLETDLGKRTSPVIESSEAPEPIVCPQLWSTTTGSRRSVAEMANAPAVVRFGPSIAATPTLLPHVRITSRKFTTMQTLGSHRICLL